MNKIYRILRYDLPLHFMLFFTNWLPDLVIVLKIRGFLCRPFFGKAGKNLRLGRNLTFYNPQNIEIGNNVYIAYGNWFSANEKIIIDDEVLIGPYCVFASSNHTKKNGSYRYGKSDKKSILIKKGSWIGAQSVITAGSIIEEGVLIGGNSLVRGKLYKQKKYAGNPVKEI